MKDSFPLLVAGYSETHTRPYNQDRTYPEPSTLPTTLNSPLCVAVADGMGGTQEGALAASLAVQAMASLQQSIQTGKQPKEAISTTYRHINHQIIQHAGGQGISGTTLSLLVFDQNKFTLGHLGDSRVYLWRHQSLHLLTQDDNAFGSFVKQGYVPFHPQQLSLTQDDRDYLSQHQLYHNELFYIPPHAASTPTPTQALSARLQGNVEQLHKQGVIVPVGAARERLMWALGKQSEIPLQQSTPLLPNQLSSNLQEGDLFLLCTDGLHGVFTHEELQARVKQVAERLSPKQAQPNLLSWGCDFLLQEACDAGSNDNISLLLVQTLASPSKARSSKPVANPNQAAPAPLHPPDITTHPTTPKANPNQAALAPHSSAETDAPSRDTHSPAATLPPQKEATTSQSQERFWHNTTLLYLVITGLSLLLISMSLSQPNSPTQPTHRHKSSNHPAVQWKTGSPVALFAMPLPTTAQTPTVERRIAALRTMYRSYHTVQTLWQISPETQQKLEQALHHPNLRYRYFLRVLAQAPLETHHFQAWDQAMQQAMRQLLLAVAPQYKKYLDEVHTETLLPNANPSFHTTTNTQNRLRKQMILRWRQHEKLLQWKCWQVALAMERIALFDKKKVRSKENIKQRKHQLKRAHHELKKQSPQHPILPLLHNRLQLLEALLQKTEGSNSTE